MRALLVALFGLWRATIGRIVPNSCRFRPTCSHYAQEAVIQRGLARGLALTTWRVLRCNPFNRGGYDPVVRSSRPCSARRATGD
jgi:putative membrane protein insertion efficiency factor